VKRFKLTPLEKSWALYDVGNSAFVMLVSTILPIFSESLAVSQGYTVNQATTAWSYLASATTLIFVILGPVLGAFADIRDRKRTFFLVSVAVGVAGCALMGFMPIWALFLAVFAVGKIGYNASLVFYDSMLTDITEDSRMSRVSTLGFAYGYIGSCIPFVAGMAFVLLSQQGIIPMPLSTACLIALLICAVWWAAMTMPLMQKYKQRYFVERPPHPIRDTFAQLGRTIVSIRKNKPVLLFLLAFFFYIDGVYTIIEIATPYGRSMGLEATDLLLALLMTQIIAFPCALIFGRLSAKIKSRRLLQMSILFYVGVAIFAFFLRSPWQFWTLAALVGMVQGGVQALSRSYYARLIPKEHSNEFFGFYDIFGKGASVLGTFLMGFILQQTNRPELGVIPIGVMFVIGLIILTVMPKNAADREN
jgi:UMF1 family MFS transporter